MKNLGMVLGLLLAINACARGPQDNSSVTSESSKKLLQNSTEESLLLKFTVPKDSVASDAFPFYIEAGILKWDAPSPAVLEAFVLVPLEQGSERC